MKTYTAQDILKILNERREYAYQRSDYGAYDHDRGVNTLYRCFRAQIRDDWLKDSGFGDNDWSTMQTDEWAYCPTCENGRVEIANGFGFCPKCGKKYSYMKEYNIIVEERPV